MNWLLKRLFLLCAVHCSLVECVPYLLIIGDQVKFPALKGRELNGCELRHCPRDASDRLVAAWDDLWTPAPDFRDRMTPNETVTLNSANANDAGLYELACGTGTGKVIQPLVHVHVFLSTNRTVTEGDSVSFASYANTRGRGVFTVARNEKPVFGLDYGSGKQTRGPGFEDRVSISPQWKDEGNLTITLKGATTADEGVYFFYVRDKLGETVPLHAARLNVNTRVPDQTTNGPATQSENNIWTAVPITSALLAGLVAGLVVGLVVGRKAPSLLGHLKTCRSRSRCRPDAVSHPDAAAQLLNGNSRIPEASLESSHAESKV